MDHVVSNAAPVEFENILARQTNCRTDCPTTPVCPGCPAGQECQATITLDCTECAQYYCTPVSTTSTPAPPAPSGPSVGAIAGGVVGGVAAIGIITYLVWKFCIKSKREPLDQEAWDDEKEQAAMEAEKDLSATRDQRSSTHTRHSVASTVLTRASNIIQIAYIPGVTNRATPTSPTLLVPPVPPIPITVSQASSPAATEDQHFFMPSDLRDSTYSAVSGYTDRTSYARTSYAPRSSIASTIYGKSAVVLAPAQTGMRAKPAMVSVKSMPGSGANSSGSRTPPVPSVDYERFNNIPGPPSPAASTFSVGSTFLNNASASTAMAARPQVVRVGSVRKKPSNLGTSVENSSPPSTELPSSATSPSPTPPSSSSSTNPPKATATMQPSVARESAVTIIEEEVDGPFTDPPKPHNNQPSTTSLSAVIEEATRRASQRDAKAPGEPTERERSPFGDEHATRE